MNSARAYPKVVPLKTMEQASSWDVAAQILDSARVAMEQHGHFTVVLAGGRTPLPIYRAMESIGGVAWDRWTVLLSDERCLPANHEGRNDAALARSLPSLAGLGRILPVPVELGAELAADRYAQVVEHVGRIDLALLGLGADGHTASLFTQCSDGGSRATDAACCAVHDAPGPYPERVSLTARTLSEAREVWFVVDADDQSKDEALVDLVLGEGIAGQFMETSPSRIVLVGPECRTECTP